MWLSSCHTPTCWMCFKRISRVKTPQSHFATVVSRVAHHFVHYCRYWENPRVSVWLEISAIGENGSHIKQALRDRLCFCHSRSQMIGKGFDHEHATPSTLLLSPPGTWESASQTGSWFSHDVVLMNYNKNTTILQLYYYSRIIKGRNQGQSSEPACKTDCLIARPIGM